MPPERPFPVLPPGFEFGVSTSAYQIEGAVDEDGRGPSIWDTFSHTPGRTLNGDTGDVACDHYHRWAEDLGLVARLGVQGYRMSLAWPRIQPTGSGTPERRALDHYDRVIDGVLEAGADPMVTLYQWDLPQALEDDGGWLNRVTADRFADYAAIVADRYADRVTHWVPVNEPNVAAYTGYGIGTAAPGRELLFDSVAAAHHLLLGHGRAAAALHAAGASSVGCANNHAPMWPATDDPADVGAGKLFDAFWNGMFLEPMLLGRYPEDLLPLLEPEIVEGDLAMIRQPLDFYGVNYYSPMKVAATDEDAALPFELRPLLGFPTTDGGWTVVPSALREWLITARARYRAALPPIVITEAGCAYDVRPGPDGGIEDQQRIDYLDSHLRAVADAVQRGVDVRGFYTWSLLDGFEWGQGYSLRYGLVDVDHETQRRTPKASFDWYAGMIAAQSRSVG